MRRLAFFAALFVLLNIAVAAPAAAQEAGIVLKSEQVTDQFPEGILFQVKAETIAPAQVKEIKLEMKVKGSNRSSYAYLEFAPATAVEGKYLLKTAGAQYKPPGTSIEYAYIITDTETRVLETARKTHLYLDSRFQWERVSNETMEVYYYGPLKKRAELIMKAGAEAVRNVGALLGYQPAEPVRIIAYLDARDMIPAQPFESRTTERELLLEGVTFPEYGTLLMIASLDRPDGVASHEITHVIAGKVMQNKLVDVPSWLSEGLAEYGNVNRSGTYAEYLSRAIADKRLMPLRNLQAYPGLPEERLLMYGRGYAVVAFMIDKYGEDKFRNLFASFNKGLRIDEALKSVYGFDMDGLDNAWRASKGIPPVEKVVSTPPASPTPAEPVKQTTEEADRVRLNLTPIIGIVAAVIALALIGGLIISRTRPKPS